MNSAKEMVGFDELVSELESSSSSRFAVEDLIYLQDFKQRKIYLTQDISTGIVSEIIRNILQYNLEDYGIEPDKRSPIYLYISSGGGEVDAGFALIDVITSSKTPVYTINLGYEYSMAFLIGISGHKRFSTEHSKFLMHDGFIMACDSLSKVHDQMEFNKKSEERIKRFVLSHSNIEEEEYDKKLRDDWYMFSDEAKEKGFIDYIIGPDCNIDDII